MNKQKSKYSKNLEQLEETLRNRVISIKHHRLIQEINIVAPSKKNISSLKNNEPEHFERLLMSGMQGTIEEIKEYAQDKVH
jgi:hypothetical protein